MAETLGKLIADFRKKSPHNQTDLAKKFGLSKQWLGAIEVGNGLPSLEQLLKLHEELVPKGSQAPESDLGTWLLKWLETKIRRDSKIDKEVALKALNDVLSQKLKPVKSISGVPTLADFPHGFENLMIICGDRRESPARKRGDFFVESFSSSDLASLNMLFEKTGPLEIRSDKLFISGNATTKEHLKQFYGKRNLIVIGSPAVNLVARAINSSAVFRFIFSDNMPPDFLRSWDEGFPELNDRELRKIFSKMTSKWTGSLATLKIDEYRDKKSRIQPAQISELADKLEKLLGEATVKDVKAWFHNSGFHDPIANKKQGYFFREDNDFGVISLCPNPYADEDGKYFCILAAGSHGPGTDMAVRVLAKNEFEDDLSHHPLGGVIEVKLDLEARWSEIFPTASFKWETPPYSIDKELMEKLGHPAWFSRG